MRARARAALNRGRRAAEDLMTDRVVIRRKVGETTNEHHEVIPILKVVYDPREAPHFGKAKVQTYEGHEVTRESAGATVTIQRSQVQLPVGALVTQVGDLATLVHGSSDEGLVGRHFRIVQHNPIKTHATAYRAYVDEVVGQDVPPWPQDDEEGGSDD